MRDFRTPYPSYEVLDKWDSPSWNDQTREVVRRRLDEVPERQFLTAEQWALLEAIATRLVPQPERAEPVPITPWIDETLQKNEGPGYRCSDMPPMREAWTRGLDAIAAECRERHGKAFGELTAKQQDTLLGDIQHGRGQSQSWGELRAERFFVQLLMQVVAVYYEHPAAWSEIGYGGPASPRGYVRLGLDERDPWEAVEVRADAD